MRDPERIDRILNNIRKTWKKYPDLRLMQLLFNAGVFRTVDLGVVRDPFHTEDDIVEKALEVTYGE